MKRWVMYCFILTPGGVPTRAYSQHAWGIRFYVRARVNTVQRALITVPALAHLSLDLANIVPSIKRSRSMLEVDEY